MTTTSPAWPAVIHHRDDAELLYIEDQQQWDSDPDLSRWRYDADDVLIDSYGHVFGLGYDQQQDKTVIIDKGDNISVDDFNELVKKHLFALANTCIPKVAMRDYDDGFKTIAMLSQQ